MTPISTEYPDLALYLVIEKMQDPEAHFWNLSISLDGTEPPPPLRPLRVFRLLGTVEALEQALKQYPCDNVNIFSVETCPVQIIQTVRSLFEALALKKLETTLP